MHTILLFLVSCLRNVACLPMQLWVNS